MDQPLAGVLSSESDWGSRADMDVFDFDKVKHIGRKLGKRDVIKDWEDGVDKIDFSDIDAIEGGTDDAFTFIGKAEFTGTAGELLYKHTAGGHTVIKGDTDGDGFADFALRLKGIHDLDADDFIL